MISNRVFVLCSVIFLCIFTVLSVGSALRESLTYDEIVHIQEGKNALLKHQFLIDTNNPPLIRELAVIPMLFGGSTFSSRMVIVSLGVLLGVAITLITKLYLGNEVALLALFFYVFEPDILAHSHLVTQDLGAALFFFLAYFALVRLLNKTTTVGLVNLGISIGLMAASKITTLPYFVFSAFILVVYKNAWRHAGKLLIAIAISALIIWSTYCFKTNVIIAPSNAQGRVSQQLEKIAKNKNSHIVLTGLNFLRSTPVPLGDYIAVLKNTVVRSSKPMKYFFLGTFYDQSHWYFMIVNVLFKTPLLLIGLAIAGLFSRRRDIVFYIPIFSILLVASISRMQPFVRYVLPVYPFIIIIAASAYSYCTNRLQKILFLILCLWYAFGTISTYPHFMAYANELVGSKYTSFIDSNIDWGQSLPDMQIFVETIKPSRLQFSYFGRDDAAIYGLSSDFAYGSYKFNEICAFHDVFYRNSAGPILSAISISNWRYCGYDLDPRYSISNVKTIIGKSIFVY
jgi:4-amino-4-deoxy-L-arabinose transferase-like glycosyltransferase